MSKPSFEDCYWERKDWLSVEGKCVAPAECEI